MTTRSNSLTLPVCRYAVSLGLVVYYPFGTTTEGCQLVLHRHLAEHGLLSFLSLFGAFLLNVIKRNYIGNTAGPPVTDHSPIFTTLRAPLASLNDGSLPFVFSPPPSYANEVAT